MEILSYYIKRRERRAENTKRDGDPGLDLMR